MGNENNGVPKMPDSYKAAETGNCGFTKSNPRPWTDQEITWCEDLQDKGFTKAEIAESVGRTEISVSIKMKRLKKGSNTYNRGHLDEKYATNKMFAEKIKPATVLDVFAGCNPYWKNLEGGGVKVVSNDKNEEFNTDLHLDALKLLCCEYMKDSKYDIVDLDPFGSAYDCFDLAIKMAKKGLIVTLGEMGHKRWHRLDFVKSHYGIEDMDDFTTETLVAHIQKIGLRNKKNLVPYAIAKWPNISRVWFEVEPVKITEQWESQPVKTHKYYQQDLYDQLEVTND